MKAYRENGNLIVAVEEKNIISAATGRHEAKMLDSEVFLNFVAANIVEYGTHDNELLNQLLDNVIEDAIIGEEGATCVEDSE